MTSRVSDATGSSGLFQLPLEIRSMIYPRVLFLGEPLFLFKEQNSPVEAFVKRGKPARWLSLLYTCRLAHQEATEFVYSTNRFIMVDTSLRQLSLIHSFFQAIGSTNTNHLTHLTINFPFTTGNSGAISFQENALESLSLLQQQCQHLQTLEMMVHSDNFQGLIDVEDQVSQQSAKTVLAEIEQRLATLPSVTTVRVVFHSNRNAKVERLMEDLGWEVRKGGLYT